MHIKFLPLVLAIFCTSFMVSQNKDSFGTLTPQEESFTAFAGDATANAVVLNEKGDNYFEVIGNRIWLIKEYHGKIKILDETGFEEGTISIPYYKGENSSERVKDINALTHNGKVKTGLRAEEIFTNNINERWSEIKFTFPNIKKGSVLEYRYKIISPFIYHLNGWSFQANIPKVYSEFNAKIPGNYIYNRSMIGQLQLDINDAEVKKECFHIDGFVKSADCEILKYAMKDIPAFKEEDYMLASSNYISRIDFELSEYRKLDGTTDKYTKSWKDVDSEFRSDKDIGRQLTKKGYFEKNVPEALLIEGDALTRAKNIYKFVQDHYTWNGNYGIYQDIRVKEAFDRKTGNIGEINISLINLLNAADIPAQLMLTSTRNHGLPKRSHPVMSDFNYIVARTVIEGKEYFLDASDKFYPFGMLPYRTLNYYGRVMDFKQDSYWQDITIDEHSKYMVRAQVSFDPDEKKATGIFEEVNIGYDAVFRRNLIDERSEERYLEDIEKRMAGDFGITSYELLEDRSDERMLSERFNFELENLFVSDVVYFDPFLVKFFEKDPFLSEKREFPIDFAYNRNYTYNLSIVLPEGYRPENLPENRTIALPEHMGLLKFTTVRSGNTIMMHYNLVLNRSHFSAEWYPALKEIFKQAIDVQNNSLIVLKRSKT